MSFENEYASGDSLLALQHSEALRDFAGIIAPKPTERTPPVPLNVPRRGWLPHRVLAVDGSNVAEIVRNGFPMAEAGLVQISVVSIDLTKLAAQPPGSIPAPKVFHDMERASTVDAVLPGANVVRKDFVGDTPKNFFRATVHKTLNGEISANHETLIETYRAIIKGRKSNISCPMDGCNKSYIDGNGEYNCVCGYNKLFETDALRFHERFNEVGTNGEVHGEVRHVIEVLVLINILRFFASDNRCDYLRDCAFVLDGPLAMFGQPAWLTPFIRAELKRINDFCRQKTGHDIIVFGIEKSGQFVNHFEEIDWTDERGPRSKFSVGTVFAPDASYINKNIVLRDSNAKPHGEDTYFGRKIFYKLKTSEHAVITTAMLNEKSQDFYQSTLDCYPRLGDILDILDHLSTYLFKDGFMPLVRAHAHAAIPLQRGADIIKSLFDRGV